MSSQVIFSVTFVNMSKWFDRNSGGLEKISENNFKHKGFNFFKGAFGAFSGIKNKQRTQRKSLGTKTGTRAKITSNKDNFCVLE